MGTVIGWGELTIHNGVAASFFPAQVSSIQFARDVKLSIFAEEAERFSLAVMMIKTLII